jgi:hypothetical protein
VQLLGRAVERSDTLPCSPPLVCDATWAGAGASVARVLITEGQQGSTQSLGSCTGSLINSADGRRQYLLTAGHCLTDKAKAASLNWFSRDWNLLWNYVSGPGWPPERRCTRGTAGSCAEPPGGRRS